jgi:hypothetical protein
LPIGTAIIIDWATGLEGPHEWGPKGPDTTHMRPFGAPPATNVPPGLVHGYYVPFWIQGYGKAMLLIAEGGYVGNVISDLYRDYSYAPEAAQGMAPLYHIGESVEHVNQRRGRSFYSPRLPRFGWRPRDPRMGLAVSARLMAITAEERQVHHQDDDLFPAVEGALESPAPATRATVARRSGWERPAIRMVSATSLEDIIVAVD